MAANQNIPTALRHLNPLLIDELMEVAIEKDIPDKTEILREGQYVKVIPIVLDGLVKVFSRYDDKELLLYYIRPNESCIMSFSASMKNEPSKVFAMTEGATKALLIPTDRVDHWIKKYPGFNTLFYQQYNLRYSELLETISQVLFNKMDRRLFDYLQEKVNITGNNPLKISHRQIANDLGTAREVVSRVMKKLETEGKVKQHPNNIEIL